MWKKYLLFNETPQNKASNEEKSLWMVPVENLYGRSVHERGWERAVWPENNAQMFIKVAQNDFTRKMIDFDTFTKIA